MKFYIEPTGYIYIEENKYTKSLFKLSKQNLLIYSTVSGLMEYKYGENGDERIQREIKDCILCLTEEDLLKPENEKLLFSIYKKLSNKRSWENNNSIISIMVLIILLENKKIKEKIIQIKKEKKYNNKYDDIVFNSNSFNLFGPLKIYIENINRKAIYFKSNCFEFLQKMNQGKMNVKCANYMKNKSMEEYEIYMDFSKKNPLWLTYKSLIKSLNLQKNDTNNILLNLYILHSFFNTPSYIDFIKKFRKEFNYIDDEKVLQHFNLFFKGVKL